MKINVVNICHTPGCHEEAYSDGACIDCMVECDQEALACYSRNEDYIPCSVFDVPVRFPDRFPF